MQTVEERRRSNRPIARIGVDGFVSVMLVLLFIILAPGMGVRPRNEKDVDIPRVNHPIPIPDVDQDDAMVIVIDRDGRLWFGNDRIEPSSLLVKILDRVKRGEPSVVYLKVDARAKYQVVRNALG